MGQRDETTGELSERVWARLRREYSLVASEVWVDDDHRVDFIGFRPERMSPFPSSIERGEFVFVEVKSCMADFKSGHGLTFQGDANWLVCPPDLAQSLYETRRLPASFWMRWRSRIAGDGNLRPIGLIHLRMKSHKALHGGRPNFTIWTARTSFHGLGLASEFELIYVLPIIGTRIRYNNYS